MVISGDGETVKGVWGHPGSPALIGHLLSLLASHWSRAAE